MGRGEAAASQPQKLAADVLAFMRRAGQMLEDIGPSDAKNGTADADDDDDVRTQQREIADTIAAQVQGSEIHCARHVFGSTVLQRALALCSDALRDERLLRDREPAADGNARKRANIRPS